MLKFVFMVLFMISCVGNWYAIQIWLFLGSLLFGLAGLSSGLGLLGYGLGVDYISHLLILLSFWVTSLSIMSSQKVLFSGRGEKVFLFLALFLLFVLVLTFSCLDYLMFYFCFESSLIPIFILILGWGYQPERLRAASYLLFYTVYGSVPLLISLTCLYFYSGSSIFSLSKLPYELCSDMSFWYVCSVVGFFVKMPVYGVHIWLPKAHVEAPVAGSMILAGVLLKLGGYGVLRLSCSFSLVMMDLSELWVSLGLLGGSYVAVMCLRQVDMKSLIAYSSVAHMGMVLCGVMVFNWWGVTGAVAMMVGHGLCSSGLFCLANIAYERYNSRSLLVSYGLLNLMPSMCLWWFLLSIGNMAAPPALNLLGEIGCIMGVVSWGYFSILSLAGLSFFSAAYTLYLFSSTQHGPSCSSLYSCCSGKVREYLVAALHWVPLNFMVLKGGMFVV